MRSYDVRDFVTIWGYELAWPLEWPCCRFRVMSEDSTAQACVTCFSAAIPKAGRWSLRDLDWPEYDQNVTKHCWITKHDRERRVVDGSLRPMVCQLQLSRFDSRIPPGVRGISTSVTRFTDFVFERLLTIGVFGSHSVHSSRCLNQPHAAISCCF